MTAAFRSASDSVAVHAPDFMKDTERSNKHPLASESSQDAGKKVTAIISLSNAGSLC